MAHTLIHDIYFVKGLIIFSQSFSSMAVVNNISQKLFEKNYRSVFCFIVEPCSDFFLSEKLGVSVSCRFINLKLRFFI